MSAVPATTNVTMRNANAYFGRLATSNYYQFFIIPGWDPNGFFAYLKRGEVQQRYGINYSTFQQTLGLLCSSATLPASSYATSEIKDNFMGITQEFAHTRMYTDIDVEFYIDRDYQVLGFFEAWMDYISGGGEEPQVRNDNKFQKGYYRRMNYPDFYKTDGIYIKKFEKDWRTTGARNISYQLINAFPKSMSSIPISYGGAELLKVSLTLNYDRHIIRRESAPINSVDFTNLIDNTDSKTGEYKVPESSLTDQQKQIRKYTEQPPNDPYQRYSSAPRIPYTD